jgi:hypothetical protein
MPIVQLISPRKTEYFTSDAVPWEHSRLSSTDSRKPSLPKEQEMQPRKVEINPRTGLPTGKLTAHNLSTPLRKIHLVGMKHHKSAEPKQHLRLAGLPPSSNLSIPVPPALTPAGDHIHDHGEDMAKPNASEENVSKHKATSVEHSKPIEEEGLKKRMQHDQRLKGHDDVRGYLHAGEDSLHALADRERVPHDHAAITKAQEHHRQTHRLSLPESPPSVPLSESPLQASQVDEKEPPAEPTLLAEESRRPSSKTSEISMQTPTDPAFDNPLRRMLAQSVGYPWRNTQAGREWINRLLGYDETLEYHSQLTGRPRRSSFPTPLQPANDGSLSDPGQTSYSTDLNRPTVQFQEPGTRECDVDKVIMDLELLLREALHIAKRAAEADQSQEDCERTPRMTVEGDRRKSIFPPTKVRFIEQDEKESSTGQFKKARRDSPYPRDLRRQSLAALPPQPEASSESLSSNSSDKVETPPGQPTSRDWAYSPAPISRQPTVPVSAEKPLKEETRQLQRRNTYLPENASESPSRPKRKRSRRPTIQPRVSSLILKDRTKAQCGRPPRAPRREITWWPTLDPTFSSTDDEGPRGIQLSDPEKQAPVFRHQRPQRPPLLSRGSGSSIRQESLT